MAAILGMCLTMPVKNHYCPFVKEGTVFQMLNHKINS